LPSAAKRQNLRIMVVERRTALLWWSVSLSRKERERHNPFFDFLRFLLIPTTHEYGLPLEAPSSA